MRYKSLSPSVRTFDPQPPLRRGAAAVAKRSWVGSLNLFIMVALLPAMALARVVAPAVTGHQAPQRAPAVALAVPPASAAATTQTSPATPNPSVAGKRQPAGSASTPVPAGVAGPTPSPHATGLATGEPNPRPTPRATARPTPGATARPTPAATARPTPKPTSAPTPPPTPKPTPAPTGGPPSTSITHVVVVWLENNEYSSVTAASMPYLYGLGQTYGVATNYFASHHPSLPNYLDFWSGSNQGVTDDAIHNLSGASISNQMDAAGKSWRSYQQDYPSTGACSTAPTYSGPVDGWGVAGTYARKHNPAMSFTYVNGNAARCANIQNLAKFNPLVNFAFVSPNLCNDAHDCSLATADTFLTAFLPQVFNSSDWAHTLLIVTFDEGSTGTNGGGHIYTMVARPGLSHFSSATVHNHYGMLRTIENIFGLPCLANACSATPLSEFLP